MIAIIHVTLTRGEFSSRGQLKEMAASIYPPVEDPSLQNNIAPGLQSYVSSLASESVYSCVPRPASQALYLWLNAREFEVVIETFHHGHLLRSAESTVRSIDRRLNQLDKTAEVNITLQSPGDAQTYITGNHLSIWGHLWDRLKGNVVALIIGIIIAIIAKIWLTDYFDDAIAGIISLLLFSLWEGYVILNKAQKNSLDWRIHE